jgi:hypothetical protein
MYSFDTSKFSTEDKIRNFPKFVRRQHTARFLARWEIFKRQLDVKGSIVECGVHQGGGLLGWGHYSVALEPYNYHREIIGFDTFEGFPSVHVKDGKSEQATLGNFSEKVDIYEDISHAIEEFNKNRFLNNKEKIKLVKGDAIFSIPNFLVENPHTLISLLYLDFDLYEPTVTALENFLPRIPKGGIVAFDELNNSVWPGETIALLEKFELNKHKVETFTFEPEISFIQL